jgi:hypothetical protein
MDTLKRWARGVLTVALAWLGGLNEFPLGQYDAKPVEPDETEDANRASAPFSSP